MTKTWDVLHPYKCVSRLDIECCSSHSWIKVSFCWQSSACEGLKSGRQKRTKISPSPIILSPFVLQKGSAWFLSHVDWNRVDMHECESVLRVESREQRRVQDGDREREMCDCLSHPLHGLFVFLFAVLPCLRSHCRTGVSWF